MDVNEVNAYWRQRLVVAQQEHAENTLALRTEVSRLQNRCNQLLMDASLMRAGCAYDFKAFCDNRGVNGYVPLAEIYQFLGQYANGLVEMPTMVHADRKRFRDSDESILKHQGASSGAPPASSSGSAQAGPSQQLTRSGAVSPQAPDASAMRPLVGSVSPQPPLGNAVPAPEAAQPPAGFVNTLTTGLGSKRSRRWEESDDVENDVDEDEAEYYVERYDTLRKLQPSEAS